MISLKKMSSSCLLAAVSIFWPFQYTYKEDNPHFVRQKDLTRPMILELDRKLRPWKTYILDSTTIHALQYKHESHHKGLSQHLFLLCRDDRYLLLLGNCKDSGTANYALPCSILLRKNVKTKKVATLQPPLTYRAAHFTVSCQSAFPTIVPIYIPYSLGVKNIHLLYPFFLFGHVTVIKKAHLALSPILLPTRVSYIHIILIMPIVDLLFCLSHIPLGVAMHSLRMMKEYQPQYHYSGKEPKNNQYEEKALHKTFLSAGEPTTPEQPHIPEIAIALPLPNGNVAFIDKADYDLSEFSWHTSKSIKYVQRKITIDGKRKYVFLHRLIGERILNRPLTQEDFIDHRNGNLLDNRRENLIPSTRSETMQRKKDLASASGYRGVYYDKRKNKYQAAIYRDNKKKSLGLYNTKEEAAKAYNEAAIQYFGENAKLNELPDRPTEHTDEITRQEN